MANTHMIPNPQQQAVIDWTLNGSGSALTIARAGCGKTSLICAIAHVIPPTQSVFVGAFNKAIAEEIGNKIDQRNVDVKTFHAIGLQCFRRIQSRFEINGYKVKSLARRRHAADKKSAQIVTDAVGFAKQAGFGLPSLPLFTDSNTWRELLDSHELLDEISSDVLPSDIIESCKIVYRQSLDACVAKGQAEIDFNDMIFAPLYFAAGPDDYRRYDWVLADEVQDQNAVRRMLAERLLNKGGRFLGVGDPAQAIYAFAGADCGSMDRTKDYMQCVEFPLNLTYRCPKSIVELAQQWVPDFQAHETNPEGHITHLHHSSLWRQMFNADQDVILCRNRRPLVGIAKRLRKMGVMCKVEGGNGRGLIALAEKWGDTITIDQLFTCLATYQQTEVAKYEAKGREDKAEAVNDKVDILQDLMDGMSYDDSVELLVKRIDSMFDDSGESPVLKLCTIHRAKGREWERVFLIGRKVYQPSYWAVKSGNPETLQQEKNLEYVAVTRVQEELVEVEVPERKKRKKGGDDDSPEWWEEV